jgi:hypothetical protein
MSIGDMNIQRSRPFNGRIANLVQGWRKPIGPSADEFVVMLVIR